MKKFLLIVLSMTILVVPSFADGKINRTLKDKVGIGFNTTYYRVPALACRYWLTDAVGVEGFTGFSIRKRYNTYIVGLKLLRIIKSYKSLNLLASTTLELHEAENSRAPYTRFNFLAGVGIEWFVLDNLSLSTEIGFKFETGSANVTNFSTDVNTITIPVVNVKFYL
ncbi:MAG: hypothetical protein LE168_02410 [Endomicrobium sp.]|nr:hypothetical protein [Endomicrobium sp.]